MKKLYPTDCINNNCNKIVYVERHRLGLGLQCEHCINKRNSNEKSSLH